MLAEQHSDKLRGVAAVDGLPVFPGFDKMTPEQRAQSSRRLGAMMAQITTAQQLESIEKTYTLPNLMTSQDDVNAVAPLVAKSDPKATGAWLFEDMHADSRPDLKSIGIPLLEIAPYDASLDAGMFPSAQAKQTYYASLLASDPSARVMIVEPSRHFIMYDQPEKLDAALKTFLQKLQ